MEGQPQKKTEKERAQTQIDDHKERRLEWVNTYSQELNVMEIIASHAVTFLQQHPRARDYILFHILIGSTPLPHLVKLDTGGVGEVERLYDEIEKDLIQKSEQRIT